MLTLVFSVAAAVWSCLWLLVPTGVPARFFWWISLEPTLLASLYGPFWCGSPCVEFCDLQVLLSVTLLVVMKDAAVQVEFITAHSPLLQPLCVPPVF